MPSKSASNSSFIHKGRRSESHLFNLSEFVEMLFHDLLHRSRIGYSTNIERPVLSLKRSNASHIISIVGVLLSTEAIERGIGELIFGEGESMKVVAFGTERAAAAGEEEAAVFVAGAVASCVAGVVGDVDPGLGFDLLIVSFDL